MKDYIKTLALCAGIALTACGCSTDSADEEIGQETNAPERNNAHISYTHDGAGLPLERMTVANGVESCTAGANTMAVCRSAVELARLFPGCGGWEGVDFSKHSVIVVRVATNYGIAGISYSLRKTDGTGYKLSVEVTTYLTCVLDEAVLVLKTDALPQGAVVDFELKM